MALASKIYPAAYQNYTSLYSNFRYMDYTLEEQVLALSRQHNSIKVLLLGLCSILFCFVLIFAY